MNKYSVCDLVLGYEALMGIKKVIARRRLVSLFMCLGMITVPFQYASADEIIEKMIEGNGILGDINKDADDFVYEAISEFDMFFVDDKNWSDAEDSDVKDSLRDEVMEKLEEKGTSFLAGV